MDTDDALPTHAPSPEETLALSRELMARSRSRLREIDRRLSRESGAEPTAPTRGEATV